MSRGRGRGLPPRLCLVLAALVVVVVATSLAAMFHARVGDGTVGHARPHASAPASTPGERLPVVAPNAGSRSITDAERVRNLIVKRIDSAAHARYAQPELKPARYTHVVGEIARGYDLLVLHEATLDAATERCTEDPRCQGLSFAAAVPDTKRALEIVLKTSRIASPRGGYWSWIKPIAAAPAGARRAVGRITVAPGGSNAHASITGALQPREVALDVTLVTQTSVERLWMLKKLCDVWDGPVSAAVFVVGNQLADATAEMERSMCARKGHVAYLHGRHADNYPVNALRNKARQWVTTSHWMLTDVDLWPSMGAHATLLRLLREPWAAHRKVAIVLPAFATRHHDVNRMPANLESLARCIGRRECYCFKGYPGAIPAHHLTTNYPYWWHQTTRPAGESSVYKVPCFDTIVWEPYTLLPNARTTPLFDERFNGYGKNKIQFIQHLRMAGFQFYVAPRVFLMHAHHAKSHARNAWRHHKVAMDRLFGEFVNEMSRIRDPNALPLCSERLPQFTNILRYSGDQRERTSSTSSGADEEEELIEPGR